MLFDGNLAPSKELVDVTFVMGASGVEGDAAFEKQKEIINSFVDSLKSNDTQMAVVNYGENESNVAVKLGQFKDKDDFKSCVDKQRRHGDGKALGKALDDTKTVKKYFFNSFFSFYILFKFIFHSLSWRKNLLDLANCSKQIFSLVLFRMKRIVLFIGYQTDGSPGCKEGRGRVC